MIINHYKKFEENYSIEKFFKDLCSKTIIYEIELLDFVKIFDISGDQKMLKQIFTFGEGLLKPFEENYVNLSCKIFIENEFFIEKEKNCFLNSDNFTDGEICIIKSMKKYEHSKIEISWDYFFEEILGKSKLFEKENFWGFVKEKNKENVKTTDKDNDKRYRISYEIKLNKLKNNKSFKSYKKIDYSSTTLVKGIGNICPWDRSLLKFLIKIKLDDNEIYCDNFPELKTFNEFKFAEKIKDIKKIIKTKPDYSTKIQYLIDNLIKNNTLIDTEIYDPIAQNFPQIFFEVLKTMKILQVEKINFSLNQTQIKEEFIKFDNKEIDLTKYVDTETKNLQNFNFEVTFCLLNFQENFSIFNKNIIIYSEAEKIEKLKFYKNSANFFFNKNKLKKAKKINKFLANEYFKFLNVEKINQTGDLLVRNKLEFFKPQIFFDFFDSKKYSKIPENFERIFYEEMKKVFSNLILIYFKLNKIKKFEEFFELFIHIFKNEYEFEVEKFLENDENDHKKIDFFFVDEIYEKVLNVNNKFYLKLKNYFQCEILIKKILSFYHKDFDNKKSNIFELKNSFKGDFDFEKLKGRYECYLKEYEEVICLMKQSEENRNNMYKKMFKN